MQLPIAFDGWGRMEVDLLCAPSGLAIELDGSQHLGNPDAYRRDRRKDALLQEQGYLVLRFLAEDVGSTSIKFWTPSCGPYHIKTPESDTKQPPLLLFH